MFGNKNCIDKNIQKKLKLEEVQPTDSSTYKSYQVSYDGDIINNIDIPKDKFIKDIQLGYSNASLNDDGTINIGDGSNKDQICFSISSDTGYNLKLIQLPHSNVTSDDLTEKLKTKADLVNGKVPNSQITIDTILNSNSNNPIANSTVTNNFVKIIKMPVLSKITFSNFINEINEYEDSLKIKFGQYPIIATFTMIEDNNKKYMVYKHIFIAMRDVSNSVICFTSLPVGDDYSKNKYIILLDKNNVDYLNIYEINNNTTISLNTDKFNSDYLENVLIPQITFNEDFIIYTKAIEISDTYKILPKNSNNYFRGTVHVNYNYISFVEIGTNSKIYIVSYDKSSYKLSLLNSVDLDLLHNVITYDPVPLPEDTTLSTVFEKMGDLGCYRFNVLKTINIEGEDSVYPINCEITNIYGILVLNGFNPITEINYKSIINPFVNAKTTTVSSLLKEDISNLASYTITTELQNVGTLASMFKSDKFIEQLYNVIKYHSDTVQDITKDLTIIVKANNSTIYYKGIIWYESNDEFTGYKYRGEEFDSNSDSENIDKSVIKFDVVNGEVINVTLNESTTISDLTQNINTLKTNINTLTSKHTTDINTLTAKLNTKMSVINGGSYQENEASKKSLITNVNNNVNFDTDGVGVCTINFNNSIFGGSKIDNANLVAKIYNVTADNLIEIKGTVTGKYTISGQPKGTVSGDTIGTDGISYVKHYDFDLKWNTSTNKEILYICKELNVQADLLDTLSYGIRWNSNKSSSPVCQRIGNLQMHRELPIQNGMKGCIVKFSADKKPEIQYYLDENDWRFRKDPIILKNVDLTSNEDESTEYLINDVFKTLQYKNQYIKVIIDDVKSIYKITDIDTETGKATIVSESEISTQALTIGGSRDIELGSCLNGYDGEVMVEVPEFYIRSWEKDNGDKEVRISQYKIDDTWEKQPHCLISPYCVTLLREVPENMGYLSTLPVNSAISVCNTETYCRGGVNDTAYDKYLTTDPFRTSLGKPVTNITRATMRANCRKGKDKEIMSYNQHKRILYWLYVIEYANFNCQLTYNSKLDSNGFKQGGLGSGVTTVGSEWSYYNNYRPIIYNGYTNSLGNNTGVISMSVTMPKDKENTSTVTYTMNVPRWHGIENPFGDICKNVDGIIINSSSIDKDGVKYSEVYTTDDTTLYSDSDYESMNKVGIELNQTGYIKEYDLGNTAEIIPRFNNANYYTYKCDYHYINLPAGLRTLFLGGIARYGGNAGLGCFYSLYSVGAAASDVGFRSSSNLE